MTVASSQETPRGPIGAIQTLSTLSRGAIQASLVPSGEMRGLIRSGLPKMIWRGMSSVMLNPYHTAKIGPASAKASHPALREPVGRAGGGVVIDVLDLGIFGQAGRPELAPDAGPAEPAPLGGGQVRMVIV